jgi:hypothetical protein
MSRAITLHHFEDTLQPGGLGGFPSPCDFNPLREPEAIRPKATSLAAFQRMDHSTGYQPGSCFTKCLAAQSILLFREDAIRQDKPLPRHR